MGLWSCPGVIGSARLGRTWKDCTPQGADRLGMAPWRLADRGQATLPGGDHSRPPPTYPPLLRTYIAGVMLL